MKLGIDRLLEKERELLRGRRIGLLTNNACRTSAGEKTSDALCKAGNVVAFFAPEHGINQRAEYMEPVAHEMTGMNGMPVYSLYGSTYESLKPTPDMLEKIDLFVIDAQDIGARYYTWAATMAFCMEACGEKGIELLVCDRPNPINGVDTEGALIDEGFNSFVGYHPIPNRHGMTMGELARLFNAQKKFRCPLSVITMEGWRREYFFDKTGLVWHNPSPNMRSLAAALLYPGMCLLEATNISEGRGTPTPFELFGAPFINSSKLVKALSALGWEGVKFSPAVFRPTFDKWKGSECKGVRVEITDRTKVKPYKMGLELITVLAELCGKDFAWRDKPYEFVDNIPAIDLLTGSDKFRKSVSEGSSPDIPSLTKVPESFMIARQNFLLY